MVWDIVYLRLPHGALPRTGRLSALGRIAAEQAPSPEDGRTYGTAISAWVWLDERPRSVGWPSITGASVRSLEVASADALGADPRAGDWIINIFAEFNGDRVPDLITVQIEVDGSQKKLDVTSAQSHQPLLTSAFTDAEPNRSFANRFVRLRYDRGDEVTWSKPLPAKTDTVVRTPALGFEVRDVDRFIVALRDGESLIVARGIE